MPTKRKALTFRTGTSRAANTTNAALRISSEITLILGIKDTREINGK